jgi:isopenicillin N synthase-like dioxygenase
MMTYFAEFDALHLRIMKHLAIAFKMETDDYFVERCNEKHENLRLLHYPAVPKDPNANVNANSDNDADADADADADLIQRGNIHTDFGTITLLVQDGVGGLRAQRLDGTWLSVPPIKDSIVVNIGDMFQRWSNDLLRATPHQVVESRPDDTDTDTDTDTAVASQQQTTMIPERYSIAFFCNANKSVLLECLEQCVSEENPAKYPVVNAHDYLTMRLSQTINA